MGSVLPARRHRYVTANGQKDTPHQTLGVSPAATKKQIKAAYYSRMKQLHPDVNPTEDTTAAAAQLNAAYQHLLAGASGSEDDGPDPLDVFDAPEADATELFVNPFACYGVPLVQWEALQTVAATGDPEAALQAAGVSFGEGAILYLTPAQLEIVEAELDRAAAAADVTAEEACAWFVSNCLTRANRANNLYRPNERR